MAKKNAPEDRAEAANKLLTAADELLGEKGYGAASAREVAERAGVNKALVFYYFGSLDALFDRVLERYYEAHLAAMAGAVKTNGSLQERLHRLIDAYLDFIQENTRYPKVIQQMVAGSRDQHTLVKKNLAPLFKQMVTLIEEITPATGPLAARHFFVTFSGATINYFTYAPVLSGIWGRDPLSPSALAERREHLHWLVETLLSAIEKGQPE